MKLSTKLAGGFGVVLVLLLIVVGLGISKLSNLNTSVNNLADSHMSILDHLSGVDAAVAEQEVALLKYLVNREAAVLTEYTRLGKEADEHLKELKRLVGMDEELVRKGWLNTLEKIGRDKDLFGKACSEMIEAIKEDRSKEELQSIADEMDSRYLVLMEQGIDPLIEANDVESDRVAVEASASARAAEILVSILGICAVVVGVVLAFAITRSITRAINRVVAGLSEGAEQVSAASSQVSSAGQALAQGASEQAGGLEETSSSIEEMASMTRQNAENATQANNLMSETIRVVDEATDSMVELTRSMEEISRASDQTAKIIKTIDEIAFQTNLLALNAAVEAARAGEAGAGFAVVADEVRNLAMRAAEAAKNTASLIEDTVKKIKGGSETVSQTNDAFRKVAEGSKKVGSLVGEIAAASQEQAQGIDQINRAVSEMDKVVQQNAANAEESASAAEELDAQAAQMKSLVGELVLLVAGAAGGSSAMNAAGNLGVMLGKVHSAGRHAGMKKDIQSGRRSSGKKGNNGGMTIGRVKEPLKPEQVIPLDDANF